MTKMRDFFNAVTELVNWNNEASVAVATESVSDTYTVLASMKTEAVALDLAA